MCCQVRVSTVKVITPSSLFGRRIIIQYLASTRSGVEDKCIPAVTPGVAGDIGLESLRLYYLHLPRI
jgi:hypothetical protein